jgi:hypothetical protein
MHIKKRQSDDIAIPMGMSTRPLMTRATAGATRKQHRKKQKELTAKTAPIMAPTAHRHAPKICIIVARMNKKIRVKLISVD